MTNHTHTTTLPEAKLSIHKELTRVLMSVVFEGSDETVTDEDTRDAEDLASIVIDALDLKVVEVYINGTIGCSVNLSKPA